MNQKQNNVILKRTTMLFICMSLLLAASGCYNNKTETVSTQPLEVVVLTGGHDFDQPPFYKMFDEFENFNIGHVKINADCTYFDDISQWPYNVIVFYNFNNKLSAKGRENLLKLCDKGTGVVVLHHAIAGFPDWSMWPKIVGAEYFLADAERDGQLWKRSTYKHDVTFDVKVERSKSMVTAGVNNFKIIDETYKGYRLEPDDQILMTTDEPLSQNQIGWTRRFKKSKVCYIQLGHGKEAYGNPNYKQLIKQAINWATPNRSRH